MKILYCPRNVDWIWEPSFIASALIYEEILFPMLQTVRIVGSSRDPDTNEWGMSSLSNIRSWVELPEQERYLLDLKKAEILKDIDDPNRYLLTSKFERTNMDEFNEDLNNEYVQKKITFIDQFSSQTIFGEPMYDLALSLVPENWCGSCAIANDSIASDQTIPIDMYLRQKTIRSVFQEIMPEIFIEKLSDFQGKGASVKNTKIPEIIDFLINAREKTKDHRLSFRMFTYNIASIPWEEGDDAVKQIIEERKKKIIEAYNNYRSGMNSAIGKLGGSVSWLPLIANILTFNWLGAASEIINKAKDKEDPEKKEKEHAFAFLLESEKGMRSWAKKAVDD